MKKKVWFTLLLCISLPLVGCTTVIQQVEEVTGNQVDHIDELPQLPVETTSAHVSVDHLAKSPEPHIQLQGILRDGGIGEYAGNDFKDAEVKRSLDQLPKGLSDDQVYAYLLGLVGDNYGADVAHFNLLDHPDLSQKWKAWADNHPAGPTPPLLSSSTSPTANKQVNIVILLDVGGNMNDLLDGQSKLALAETAIRQLPLPPSTTFILHTYGNTATNPIEGKEVACTHLQTIYSASSVDPVALAQALKGITANDQSPLAYALQVSQFNLPASANVENQVIVISGQGDTCADDPVSAALQLHHSTGAYVNVMGLGVDGEMEQTLRKTAEMTGGNYQRVTTNAELTQAVEQQHGEWIHLNDPWQLRALDAIAFSYISDQKQLDEAHAQMVQRSDQEYQRLDAANDYIRSKGKISAETWAHIGAWIDQRWQQVGGYADQRWIKIGSELDRTWNEQWNHLQQAWQAGGGQLTDLEARRATETNEPFWEPVRQVKERLGRIRTTNQ